VPDAMPLLT